MADLPVNFLVDEFMDQQKVTLNKLNKKEKKNDDTNAGSSTKREDLGRDNSESGDSNSKPEKGSRVVGSSAKDSKKQ